MKTLELISAMIVFGALGVGTAAASPIIMCNDPSFGANPNLQQYINLGSTGCQMNGLLFSSFSYSDNLSGVGRYASVPANKVLITLGTSATSWGFGGNWATSGSQQQNVTIAFTVSQMGNDVNKLVSQFTDAVVNPGTLSVNAACAGSGTPCATPVNFTNTSVSLTSTPGPVVITNTAIENSNSAPVVGSTAGIVHLSIITDQFAPTPPPGVPEPMTTALAGFGMLLLVGCRSRRSRQ